MFHVMLYTFRLWNLGHRGGALAIYFEMVHMLDSYC